MSLLPRLELDPFDKDVLEDPYPAHERLRDAGPVVYLEPILAFAMARHEEVKSALADHETYCSGRGVGVADFHTETPMRPPSLLLEADPPLHDRTRRLMNQIVSLKEVKRLGESMQTLADDLVERLAAQGDFDAVTDLAEVFPMAVFPDLIGLPDEGREHLLTYAMLVFNAFGPANDVLRASEEGSEEAVAWVAQACKRENLKPGGWGMAVHEAADRGDCTSAEAERLVRSFLSAGVDTTVNGIGHMILALARHPEEFAKLRAHPSLAARAFEESLRWDSTVQTFFRTTTRSVDVHGVEIPEGSKVLLFLAAANRDPRHWSQPDAYVIDRKSSGHVGFGFGIHQCLGQMLARLEGEVIARSLASKVTSIRTEGAPVRRLNNTLHALSSLRVSCTTS